MNYDNTFTIPIKMNSIPIIKYIVCAIRISDLLIFSFDLRKDSMLAIFFFALMKLHHYP
jgi:hypothetical protein